MPYYIPNLTSPTTCIGNSLLSFNSSFTALDTNLYNLSTYAHNSVNYLSSTMIGVSGQLNTKINYLSSTMIGVSGQLNTKINTASSFIMNEMFTLSTYTNSLYTEIRFVSANVINEYIRQVTLPCPPVGNTFTWNVSAVGSNIFLPITANIRLGNPTGLIAGQTGNLIVGVATVGKELTSFDTNWTFVDNLSSSLVTLSARNVISYYYDGTFMLSTLTKFTL